MGWFSKEKKIRTPEEKLVDNLVGSGFSLGGKLSEYYSMGWIAESNIADTFPKGMKAKNLFFKGFDIKDGDMIISIELELEETIISIGGPKEYVFYKINKDTFKAIKQLLTEDSVAIRQFQTEHIVSYSDVHETVKRIWKNGGNCEEIQLSYDKLVNPKKISSKKLVKRLIGDIKGEKIGGSLIKENLDRHQYIKIKKKVLNSLKNNENEEEIQKVYSSTLNNIKKKNMVYKLLGSDFNNKSGGNLEKLNLPPEKENIIKNTIVNAWQNGADERSLEKIFILTKEKISKDILTEISDDLYSFINKGIIVYHEKEKQKMIPGKKTVQETIVKDKFGNLTRAGATWGAGLAGYALTSGTKTETVNKLIDTTKVIDVSENIKVLEIYPHGEKLRIFIKGNVNYVNREDIIEYNEKFKDIILKNNNVIPLDVEKEFDDKGLIDYINNGYPSKEEIEYYEKLKNLID